jgi:hypothetical protein
MEVLADFYHISLGNSLQNNIHSISLEIHYQVIAGHSKLQVQSILPIAQNHKKG